MDEEDQFEEEEEESSVHYTKKVPHGAENLLGPQDADMGDTPHQCPIVRIRVS